MVRLVIRAATLAVLASIVVAIPASAAATETGELTVNIDAPPGVPGTVVLIGAAQPDAMAAKDPDDATAAVQLTVPVGRYRVEPEPIVIDGIRYVAVVSSPTVTVRQRRAASVDVSYDPDGGATDFAVTELPTETTVDLGWSGPPDARYVLRRSIGSEPVEHSDEGIDVEVDGTTAVDVGLTASTDYTYSLFTKLRGQPWVGPFYLAVGTASSDNSGQATYVTTPGTFLAQPSDIETVVATGSGVDLTLADGEDPLAVGDVVVLPISDVLEGGYLGRVQSVNSDGSAVYLEPAALSDAFDLYLLSIESFSATLDPENAASASTESAQDGLDRRNAAGIAATCDRTGGYSVTIDPDIDLTGDLDVGIDRRGILGKDSRAWVDATMTATATASADLTASVGGSCEIALGELSTTLTTAPVPIAVKMSAGAEFSISGGIEVKNIGLTATSGFTAAATLDLGGLDASADPFFDAAPLIPTAEVGGEASFKLGGDVLLGPGVGTTKAGVIAGIGGSLYPVDLSADADVAVVNNELMGCLTLTASFSAQTFLKASVWVAWFEASATIDLIGGSWPYAPPWAIPESSCALVNDSVLPLVSIDSPEPNGRIDSGENVEVLGTAGDDSQVVSVDVTITDGDGATWDGELFTTEATSLEADLSDPNTEFTGWSVTFVPPLEGEYQVDVVATDATGKVGSASQIFGVVEAGSPEIEVLEPSSTSISYVDGDEIEVSGMATDDIGVASVDITVTNGDGLWWDGAQFIPSETSVIAELANPNSQETSWTSGFSPDGAGTYTIVATAEDDDAKTVSATRIVNLSLSCFSNTMSLDIASGTNAVFGLVEVPSGWSVVMDSTDSKNYTSDGNWNGTVALRQMDGSGFPAQAVAGPVTWVSHGYYWESASQSFNNRWSLYNETATDGPFLIELAAINDGISIEPGEGARTNVYNFRLVGPNGEQEQVCVEPVEIPAVPAGDGCPITMEFPVYPTGDRPEYTLNVPIGARLWLDSVYTVTSSGIARGQWLGYIQLRDVEGVLLSDARYLTDEYYWSRTDYLTLYRFSFVNNSSSDQVILTDIVDRVISLTESNYPTLTILNAQVFHPDGTVESICPVAGSS